MSISMEEQARRRRIMASVRGTHEMEGMFADEPTLAIMKRYEVGELTMQEFSAAMEAHAVSLLPTALDAVA